MSVGRRVSRRKRVVPWDTCDLSSLPVTIAYMLLRSAAVPFLNRQFPNRADLVRPWREQLASTPCTPLGLDSYRRLGLVFEIAVSFDLADEPPFGELLDCLPDSERTSLLTATGYAVAEGPSGSWRRATRCELPVDHRQEAALDTVARMHVADEMLGKDRLSSPEQRRLLFQARDEDKAVLSSDERRALTTFWDTYLRYGRPALLALGPTVAVQPALAEGAARADIILGTTLVDIKLYYDPADSLEAILDQLLTYVLADTDDTFMLTEIAVYLGCQGALLTLDLETVLSTAWRAHVTWSQLREWFFYDTREAREESKKWTGHR